MRLFPLFSGIAAIFLFQRLARAHLGKVGLFASLLFAVSAPLIYYSSELKQYSSDVLVALALVYLASRCFKEDAQAKDFIGLGVGGTIALWISHPAAFVLTGIGLALVLEKITKKNYAPFIWILSLGLAWAISFGAEYLVSFRNLIADDFLQTYWGKSFMPLPPWKNLDWFGKTYFSLLKISLHRSDVFLVLTAPVLILLGGLSLFKQNRKIALMIIAPFFVALLASALQKYPLKDRFMLFLVPFVLLLLAAGLERFYALVVKWNRPIALGVSGVLALAFFLTTASVALDNFLTPDKGWDFKPALKYVGEKRFPNDIVYVFHGADPAFNYYAPFYNLDTGNIIIGFDTPRKKIALQRFKDDVNRLRGNDRVWFIFSDIVDCGDCAGDVGDMLTFYVNLLNGVGTMTEHFGAGGASAYLYDLNP
jgi:hypothetical protein